jgi:multidrug efflux system membrane fusion protein
MSEIAERRTTIAPATRSSLRMVARAAVLLVVAAGAGFAWWGSSAVKPAANAPAPIPVTAGVTSVGDLPVWLSGVGTVMPMNAVDVKVRIDGQLQSVAFTEGDEVAAGQVLAQIDSRPYQAILSQAIAVRQRDLAQFAGAGTEVARASKLAAAGAGTGQNLDTLKAQQAGLQASLEADQATIDAAKLNLDFTRIVSPLAGRVGMRQVDPGAIVHASDATGIVTVTQMAPIAVLFTLPQDQLAAVLEGQRQGKLRVEATARDSNQHIADGELVFINSTVDSGTGQIQMKAAFTNTDSKLWPGAFVMARVLLQTDRNAVVAPSQAIQTGQDGLYVYAIQPDNTVAVKTVTTGPTVDGVTEIRTGLAGGDKIVLDGQARLAPGTHVTIAPQTPAAPVSLKVPAPKASAS